MRDKDNGAVYLSYRYGAPTGKGNIIRYKKIGVEGFMDISDGK